MNNCLKTFWFILHTSYTFIYYQLQLTLKMAEKLNLARIKKFGNNFEISVDPDNALKYKRGEISDLREVLQADNIFTDAHKGLVVPQEQLEQAFQTTDVQKIADIIIKQGEIQLTTEHRSQEREQKRKKLVHLIQKQAIDGRTNLPLPPNRIELALEEAKINLDDHKTVEEQFDDVISKLRIVIPLKIEQKILTIIIPAEYTGKSYTFVKNSGKFLKEEWNSDGSWRVKIEIPAGIQVELIDKLNAITHGDIQIENE